MSSFDGAPSARVDVEHLPDRRYRLWLVEGDDRVDLGAVGTTRLLYSEAKRRVVEYLGVDPDWFYVDLHTPRPDYVRLGERVDVLSDEGGRWVAGTVVAWAQGGVHVRVDHEGVGVYAPEEVWFPNPTAG